MSITDELREYAQRYKNSHDAWSGIGDDLDQIAERIDVEHEEKVRERQKGCIYYDPERHYCSVHDVDTSAYVKLPLDADGMPICVGDVMGYADKPTEPLTVSYIELEENGWWVFAGGMGRRPDKYRHHHEPTVEDVLREFAEKVIDSQIPSVHPTYEEAIAEYAAKLRLAGDGE